MEVSFQEYCHHESTCDVTEEPAQAAHFNFISKRSFPLISIHYTSINFYVACPGNSCGRVSLHSGSSGGGGGGGGGGGYNCRAVS